MKNLNRKLTVPLTVASKGMKYLGINHQGGENHRKVLRFAERLDSVARDIERCPEHRGGVVY